MNRIPCSVYDVFGYLASGFILLATYDYVQTSPLQPGGLDV